MVGSMNSQESMLMWNAGVAFCLFYFVYAGVAFCLFFQTAIEKDSLNVHGTEFSL